jgi:NAD(P)-dependent dehydrogenase (short-subunit alcohol dehydrogenase family)
LASRPRAHSRNKACASSSLATLHLKAEQQSGALSRFGKVVWHGADVTDRKSVYRLVYGIKSGYRRLDYAFSNCGRGAGDHPLGPTKVETWHRTVDSYLTSVFLFMSAEMVTMDPDLGLSCVIVNNASVEGPSRWPFPESAAYEAAKHGIIALTRLTAGHCTRSGPRICAILPGWVRTQRVARWLQKNKQQAATLVDERAPRARLGTAAEVAAVVLSLCSSDASFANGTVLPIDPEEEN